MDSGFVPLSRRTIFPGLAGVTYQSVSMCMCVCVCMGGGMVGIKSVIKWEDFSAESC